MAKSNKPGIFSPDMGGITEASPLPGQALVNASATNAANQATQSAAHWQGVSNLVNIGMKTGAEAVDVYKSILSNRFDANVKDTLDRLEGVGSKALETARDMPPLDTNSTAAEVGLRTVQSSEQEKQFGTGLGGPVAADYKAALNEYANARDQGIISKQEAINRIAATVKEYTARMPGWGSHFRQLAAEQTGISNIDSYNVHKALTAIDKVDHAAQKEADANLELIKKVAEFHGLIDIKEVTPEKIKSYQENKAVMNKAEFWRNRQQMDNITDEHRVAFAGQYADTLRQGTLGFIDRRLKQFESLNKSVDFKDRATQIQVLPELESILHTLEQQSTNEILAMSSPSEENKYPIKRDSARKLADENSKWFADQREYLKTQDGINAFVGIVNGSKMEVERMIANFDLANPFAAKIKYAGVFPAVVEAYFGVGRDPEKLKALFGEKLATAVDNYVTKNGEMGASVLHNVDQFTDKHTPEEATKTIGPDNTKVLKFNSDMAIKEAANAKTMTEDKIKDLKKQIKVHVNWMSFTNPLDAAKSGEFINNGYYVKASKHLTASENEEVFTPMRAGATNAAYQIFELLNQSVVDAGGSIQFDSNGRASLTVPKNKSILGGITVGGTPIADAGKWAGVQINNLNNLGTLMNQLNEILPTKEGGQTTLVEAYKKFTQAKIDSLKAAKENKTKLSEDINSAVKSAAPNVPGGIPAYGAIFQAPDTKSLDEQIKKQEESLPEIKAKPLPPADKIVPLVDPKAPKSSGLPKTGAKVTETPTKSTVVTKDMLREMFQGDKSRTHNAQSVITSLDKNINELTNKTGRTADDTKSIKNMQEYRMELLGTMTPEQIKAMYENNN